MVTVGVVKNIFIPKLLQDFDINFASSNICCSLFESRLVAVVAGAGIKDSLAVEEAAFSDNKDENKESPARAFLLL